MGLFGRIKKKAGGVVKKVEKDAKRAVKQVERTGRQVGGMLKGQFGMGSQSGGKSSSSSGPTMTDVARSQAAGAGTIGFTGTQSS